MSDDRPSFANRVKAAIEAERTADERARNEPYIAVLREFVRGIELCGVRAEIRDGYRILVGSRHRYIHSHSSLDFNIRGGCAYILRGTDSDDHELDPYCFEIVEAFEAGLLRHVAREGFDRLIAGLLEQAKQPLRGQLHRATRGDQYDWIAVTVGAADADRVAVLPVGSTVALDVTEDRAAYAPMKRKADLAAVTWRALQISGIDPSFDIRVTATEVVGATIRVTGEMTAKKWGGAKWRNRTASDG